MGQQPSTSHNNDDSIGDRDSDREQHLISSQEQQHDETEMDDDDDDVNDVHDRDNDNNDHRPPHSYYLMFGGPSVDTHFLDPLQQLTGLTPVSEFPPVTGGGTGNTTMTIGGLTSYIPFTSNRHDRSASLMPSFRPTEPLKSHLNVLKSSVHLTPSMKTEKSENEQENDENVEENVENVDVMKYRLRFQFDCTIPCQVIVHWNSVERLDANFGHLKIVNTKSSFAPLRKNKTREKLEKFGEKSHERNDDENLVVVMDESTSFHLPIRTFGAGMGHVYESPILDFSNPFHRKRNLHNFSNNDNRANDSDSDSDEQEEEEGEEQCSRSVLFYDERVNPFRYPLIIELRSLRTVHGEEEEEQDDQMENLEMRDNDLENLENEEEEKRRKTFEAERASKRSYQFTYVTFSDQNHRNMSEVLNTSLRVLRQKVQIDCKVYELAEIYSFNNTTTNDNHHRPHVVINMDENRENANVNMGENGENDEEDDDDDESGLCVICMTNVADTSLIPCRHMCLCHECSHVLRTQTNKCPICRSKILTMIRVAPEDDTNANDGNGDNSDDQER